MFTLSLSPIIIISCISAIAATMGFQMTVKMIFKRKKELHLKNKNDSKIIDVCPELPNPNWVKVGYVKALNIYPISFGTELSYHSFKFTQYGMNMEDKGMTVTDGMFLVLDVVSGKFQNSRNYKSLRNISMSVVDSYKVKFNAPGMPAFIFKLDEQTKKIFLGATWHDDSSVMECIDCGETASIWINNFLRSTNLRLVRMDYKSPAIQTNIIKENWSRYVLAHTNGHHSKIFTNLARFVLVTKSTLDRLNKEKKVTNVSNARPNIVISTPWFPPYAEKKWKWIKIGNAILRQVKPVPRYLPAYARNSLKRHAFPQISPHFGIYYGLYVAGDVKLNDEIYLHFPKDIETADDCEYSF